MKKSILLLACASMLAGSATAQVAVVKDALKQVTSSSKPEELKSVLQALQPALTADESKGDAATWFAAGKASFQLYDALNAEKLMQKEVDAKEMQTALMNGYKYFETANILKRHHIFRQRLRLRGYQFCSIIQFLI